MAWILIEKNKTNYDMDFIENKYDMNFNWKKSMSWILIEKKI